MGTKKRMRQTQIHQILLREEKVRVVQLANQLKVSPETLRKDLDEMESEQLLVREHGYARLNQQSMELPISYRGKEETENKRKITIRAIQEIQNGQVVFLDSGSTLIQGIQALRSKKDLTLVVNSLPMALECVNMNFKVIFLGGEMEKVDYRTDGYFTQKMLETIHFDLAILGTGGFKDSSGFSVYAFKEVGTRRYIINQARKLIVVADRHKFDVTSHYQYCKFKEVDLLITNPLTPTQKEQVKDIKTIIEV